MNIKYFVICISQVFSCAASLGKTNPNEFSTNSEDDDSLVDGSSQSSAADTDEKLGIVLFSIKCVAIMFGGNRGEAV